MTDITDWPTILLELNNSGLTREDICAATGAGGTTIHDLAAGTTRDPRYSLGKALLDLHSKRCTDRNGRRRRKAAVRSVRVSRNAA